MSNSSFRSSNTLDGVQRAAAAALSLMILSLLALPLSALSQAYPGVPALVTYVLTTLATYWGFCFFNEARTGYGLKNRRAKLIVLAGAAVVAWINIEWSALSTFVNTILLTTGIIELVVVAHE